MDPSPEVDPLSGLRVVPSISRRGVGPLSNYLETNRSPHQTKQLMNTPRGCSNFFVTAWGFSRLHIILCTWYFFSRAEKVESSTRLLSYRLETRKVGDDVRVDAEDDRSSDLINWCRS